MSSSSRTNGRPALAISTLPPLDLDLPAIGSAWLVCPDCNQWVEVVRGLVQVHKPAGRRCDGSAQRLAFDLTPAQHAARRVAVRAQSHSRSAAPVVRTARAVVAGGAKQATRRLVARVEQDVAETAARPSVKARTGMAAAFEDAWLTVKRVPVPAAAHQIAARVAAQAAR
jgi:hypothetical protein